MRVVEDDSDEENALTQAADSDDADDFTPVAKKTAQRRLSNARQSDVAPTPRRSTRSRRTTNLDDVADDSLMPADADSAAHDSPDQSTLPTRRSTKTARASRRARESRVAPPVMQEDVMDVDQTTDTAVPPDPSSGTEVFSGQELEARPIPPLGDITVKAVNETTHRHSNTASELKSPQASRGPLNQDMDSIVSSVAQDASEMTEPKGPVRRTVITYLILNNFKSYAGRQEVGPFHSSFSSVVGPNGSGKSNVIDSLLFVFGFRASKMRQGKLSALIHHSAQFPNLDFCEVEVHFQEVMDLPDGAGTQVVPDSQLIVSRRAFKNNSSNYYINNKTSSFTAVTTLLKDRGVDLDHKRFLILQGEVESIAQMKPKAANEHDDGLLEYLEDIIGTSKYKAPIEEAENETERLNEICTERSGRVQHVEKERNALEDKKNKALAYIRNENELTTKQSSLFQVYMADCTDNIAATSEMLAVIQAEYDAETRNHKGNEDTIKAIEAEVRKSAKQHEVLQKQADTIGKEASKHDKETVKFEEKKKFLVAKLKKLEKAADTNRYGIAEASTQSTRAETDIARFQVEIDELGRELQIEDQELSRIRESLRGKTQTFSDQIATKQAKLEPWNAKINDEKQTMAVTQSELDILLERDSAGANATAEAQAKVATLEETREQQLDELKTLASRKKQAKAEVHEAQQQLDHLLSQKPAIQTKLSSARQRADEARSSLQASKTQNSCLTGLMRLRDTGRISGFHGRLGTLGAIDAKYDVAISTACPALDNLVVDTVEIAQQCIEYLRANNLGRANFMCLDKLPQQDLSRKPTPENVPRLFDLVKPKDARFSQAFYSVIRDTIVASDSQQADRLAYKQKQRWRTVSLEGKLIETSGTMTGGGSRVIRGAMSSKIVADTSKDQVAKLEHDRESLEAQYTEYQTRLRELETTLKDLADVIPQIDTDGQKLQLGIGSLDRNIADAVKRVEELNAEQKTSTTDKHRKAELQKSIGRSESKINELQAETAGIEEQIKALQEKIMEVGGVQLRSQKAKVDGLKEQIEHRNEELSTCEVTKAKANKAKVKHEKAYEDALAEMDKVRTDAADADEILTEHKQTADDVRRQAEEAAQTLEIQKDELGELNAKLEEEQEALNGGRAKEIELRNKLKDNQKIVHDSENKLRHWQSEFAKLNLQNIT